MCVNCIVCVYVCMYKMHMYYQAVPPRSRANFLFLLVVVRELFVFPVNESVSSCKPSAVGEV
jgi:hypothetical protein